MRTILCFGASNTWGYEPGTGRRFPADVRWPGRLQSALGDGVRVLEEGLNGRSTMRGDANRVITNGLAYLRPCLVTHAPIDLIIVMLGTNDLAQVRLSAQDIADGMMEVLEAIADSCAGPDGAEPRVLVMCPSPVGPFPDSPEITQKSRDISPLYANLAARYRYDFLDAGSVAQVSPVDGVHLDADGHRALADAVIPRVRALLGL